MDWKRLGTIGFMTLSLSACATRGAISINCDPFKPEADQKLLVELEPSGLVRRIQSDAGAVSIVAPVSDVMGLDASQPGKGPGCIDDDPMVSGICEVLLERTREIARLSDSPDERPGKSASPDEQPGKPDMLLLSGGGQWGAFGAGYLREIHHAGTNGPGFPNFGTITGVSTGGLQSIFIAIAGREVHQLERQRYLAFLRAHGEDTSDTGPVTYIDLLRMNYSPAREDEVVNRNSKAMSVITGSFAGLKPLRKRIEAALCTDGDPAKGCPLIRELATSGKQVYIGFIRANDGKFVYADAVGIAKLAVGSDADVNRRRDAQQCLTGAALASAAMPVFFQQVRINDTTYYDGGVRRSVFEDNAVEKAQIAAAKAASLVRAEAKAKNVEDKVAQPAGIFDMYVIRNGPTTLRPMDRPEGSPYPVDTKADALTAAQRAEAIIVNELEVSSIASLRLNRPKGNIWLITADGYDTSETPNDNHKPEKCAKAAEVMFDPPFMACLQDFGKWKARRDLVSTDGRQWPWIAIDELGVSTAPPSPR